ncbi:hypothetical protein KL86DYS2_11405 [uncultured Dysgonomonas sp.]|uniref:Uncharacterized protein n=1 Tax=uncultured Dysgonomonas sp. TaxID=206096 RepID=A0A212JFI5_9BACT|nr:hypothetical protein KL86DYS2_11405 [uncultured Dysgonomonas sp.]
MTKVTHFTSFYLVTFSTSVFVNIICGKLVYNKIIVVGKNEKSSLTSRLRGSRSTKKTIQ